MYRRVVILVTFLAYSLTLVHSLVPHHHHEEASRDHHHHGQGSHHHHSDHDVDGDEKSVNHLFADAIHHPASEISLPAAGSEVIKKKMLAAEILPVKLTDPLSPDLKPPDTGSGYQTKYHPSGHEIFFLLRAPPIA